MSSIFNIGLSGLNAAQAGMATTQHNIANANTPGYSMQQIVQTANIAQYTGSGYIGQGTNVASVQRVYNDFLNTQILQGQAQASQLSTYQTQITQIDNVLADPNAGLSPALQGFFNATNAVANSPNSVPARQTLLSNAQALTASFQSLSQQMAGMNTSVNTQINNSVTSVNSYAQQIAVLNQNIALAQSAGNGQPPNDLLDQRDQLISQLNQQIKVNVTKQSDGSYNVLVASGQPLVVGNQAYGLKAVASATDPSRLDVAYTASGITIPLQQSSIQGGTLGGLLAFRDQSLIPAQNALGRVAIGIATRVNQQNQLGQDLNGAPGGNVFNLPAPIVNGASGNAGNAVVAASISSASALTTSDYTLKFNGGTSYTLTRLSDNNVTNLTGLPQTVDGVTLSLSSGAAVAGDSFLIRPTANAAQGISLAMSDPAKIAAAAPMLAKAALGNTGSGVISNGAVTPSIPVNANLQTPVTVTFNAIVPPATLPTYTVSGAVPAVGAPISYTPGTPISLAYNGWTAQLSGTPATGDVFNIVPNTNGSGDNRNALLMAGLQMQNTLAGGTTTFQGAYDQIVAQVGTTTSSVTQSSTAQTTMVSQLVQTQQSVSGVNLDQEAANLMRYQRAYQAAGKAIQVANTLFDTLLTLR
ncbi:MAG: flagellar hook-associated protein FlgK [Gallionella sp.]